MSNNTLQTYMIAGTSYIIVAGSGLIIYIPVMMVLMNPKYRNEFSSPFYTIVKSLGISDIFSLVLWLLLGIHEVTQGQLFPTSIVAYLLWPLFWTWMVLIWHLVLMSLDRFIAICHMTKRDLIFSHKNTIAMAAFIYFIFFCICFCFAFPECHIGYSLEYNYIIHKDTGCKTLWRYFDYVEFPVAFLTCVISQALAVRGLRAVNRAIKKADEKARRAREFRLFIQTVLVCSAFFMSDLLYYTVWMGTDDLWINFYTGMCLWEVNNMVAAVIYLTFNSSLRDKVKLMLMGKKGHIAAISFVPTSNGPKVVAVTSHSHIP